MPENPGEKEPTQSGTSEGQEGVEVDQNQSRDVYDDLLEDPQFRPQVKQAIAQFAQRGYAGNQEPQQQPMDPMQQLEAQIAERDQYIEEFFQKPDEQRDYMEYERKKAELTRLDRRLSEMRTQRAQQQMALGQSDQVIERWIRSKAEQERRQYGEAEISNYASRIREIAKGLRPDLLANEQKLRETLEYSIEPFAYKEYQQRQRQQGRPQQEARDGRERDSYTDDDADEPHEPQDKYADASDEERTFLKGLGLIKEERGKRQSELIPVKNGFAIPIRPGNRNQESNQ